MHRVISPQPIHQKPHSAANCILATCESNWAAYMNMHELPPAPDAGIHGMDNAKATYAQKAACVPGSLVEHFCNSLRRQNPCFAPNAYTFAIAFQRVRNLAEHADDLKKSNKF